MSAASPRRAGLLAGAAAGAWLALVPAIVVLVRNPWFMDAPALYLAGVTFPLALLFGLLGAAIGRGPPGAGIALAAGVLAVPLLSLWPTPAPSGRVKLFVYGVDGATFDVIDPLGDELPAFRALEADGVRATLMSMEPNFSPLLWTTMATGRPPEEHGIHGFHVQATDCRAARFWDAMHAAGLSVGTYKWLVTYPPTKLRGFQVPAWLAPAPDTWPEDLSFVKELELSRRLMRRQITTRRSMPELLWEGLRHGFRVSTVAHAVRFSLTERFAAPDARRAYFEGQILRVWMDRDVFVATLHRTDPEVVTFTTYAPDAVAHRFWKYHEPEKFPGVPAEDVARWGQAVNDTYRQADALLAELRAEMGPQARVVLVSDHGDRALTESGSGHYLSPTSERLRERLTAEIGPVDISRLGHKLVVSLQGPDPAAQHAALTTWVEGFTLASSGRPLYRTEAVPGRPHDVGLAFFEEELSADMLQGERVGGEPLSAYAAKSDEFNGDHDLRGVFYAAGPGLAKGRLADLQLFDVPSILLAMVGLPAARDMRGTVPRELWTEPPSLPAAPPTYDHLVQQRELIGAADAGVNEEQLKALGYVE